MQSETSDLHGRILLAGSDTRHSVTADCTRSLDGLMNSSPLVCFRVPFYVIWLC